MSRRQDNIDLCRDVLQCDYAAECTQHGNAMFGEEIAGGTALPAPHMGGARIDDYCILVFAQNPHTPKAGGPGEPKLHAETPEGYLLDRNFELRNHVVGDVVEDLGLHWDYLVWDNVVKCHTYDNDEPHDVLKENCSRWADRQIELLDPDYIIAMGNNAVKDYFGWDYNEFTEDHTAIYHYAYLKRFGGYDTAIANFREQVHPHLPDRVIVDE